MESYEDQARRYIELEEHPEFRTEMERILSDDDQAELKDRFYKELEFGTGGLRGVIGAGFNRLNPYTVKRATLGLVRYISVHADRPAGDDDPLSVVIAYDSRRYSSEFAEAAALVCASEGVKAYVFESVRSTPELSFAVRHLSASAGIVITASHNPPEYNGYKVYWSDGAQVVPPHDAGIIEEVGGVQGAIPSITREQAVRRGLYAEIGKTVDDAFVSMVKRYLLRQDLVSQAKGDFSVVYTPLHGTGTMPIERVFSDIGIPCTVVPEQREPDGEFPTVDSPNPEEGAALTMAIDLAKRTGADLVMGTDPDADRLGIAVRDVDGDYRLLNGNQLGSLLADYIFATRTELKCMPEKPVLVKTIVTTELQRRIAESYGVQVYDVLTGFKYIGEKIRQFEQTGESYVFGGEESYGFLVETEVRDKDSISAAAVTAEMALYARSRSMSLIEYLDDIYSRFGYFEEILISKKFEGSDGAEQMSRIMNHLRSDTPSELGGMSVLQMLDYQDRTVQDGRGTKVGVIDLPKSNVIQLKLEDALFTVRPSGTEPKIKYYASVWDQPSRPLAEAKSAVGARVEAIRKAIEAL